MTKIEHVTFKELVQVLVNKYISIKHTYKINIKDLSQEEVRKLTEYYINDYYDRSLMLFIEAHRELDANDDVSVKYLCEFKVFALKNEIDAIIRRIASKLEKRSRRRRYSLRAMLIKAARSYKYFKEKVRLLYLEILNGNEMAIR